MARKPNYDFEKKERDRLKNEKKAARAESKAKPTNAERDQAKNGAAKPPK